MNTSLSIRSAGPEDIPMIGYLAQQIWPVAYKDILSADQMNYMLTLFYSPESLMSQMLEQRHRFLVVEEGEEPLGFASWSETGENGQFKLHKIYILPNQQGKGIGKLLIDCVSQAIRPLGATALRLNVNRNNKARQFY